jgi:hypothetical protein
MEQCGLSAPGLVDVETMQVVRHGWGFWSFHGAAPCRIVTGAEPKNETAVPGGSSDVNLAVLPTFSL